MTHLSEEVGRIAVNKFDLESKDLVAAIANLYAREEIKELRARYAWYAARGDYRGIADLYVEDGIFEVSREGVMSSVEGREAIAEHLKHNLKPDMVFPTLHNQVIDVVGDEAFGTSMMVTHSQSHMMSGRYHDHFRKTNGDWLFVARRFSFYMPNFEQSDRDIYGRLPKRGD